MNRENTKPHRRLVLWQKSVALSKVIYETTNKFPDSEKYGLISQLRRAIVSVSANIAEGAARNHKKEFVQFLGISNGSISEWDTLVEIAFQLKYLDTEEYNHINTELDALSALNNGLIRKLKLE